MPNKQRYSTFLGELKPRRVGRVFVLYLAGAFAVIGAGLLVLFGLVAGSVLGPILGGRRAHNR